uniref:Odorant-binding protein 6 n=1 Tax=Ceracris kiangsu TaxID=227354 RepID=A0A1C8CIU9_CERKI|nr:odorant-binding protein 6 [Ceracris kiangsu]
MKALLVAFVAALGCLALAVAAISESMARAEEAAAKIELSELFEECNETFPIPKATINYFFSHGRLQNENDYGSKCYIHCLTDRSGEIDSDGNFDADMIKVMTRRFPNETHIEGLNEMVDGCVAARGESDFCERAYGLVSCLIKEKLARLGHSH